MSEPAPHFEEPFPWTLRSVGAALFGAGFIGLSVVGLASKLIPELVYMWRVFLVLIAFVIVGLLLLWVDHRMEWRVAGRLVRRLLARPPEAPRSPWRLPAPESYMLLRDVPRASPDALRLGVLHLVAAGALRVVDSSSVILMRDVAKPAAMGSLVAICNLWPPTTADLTVKEFARRVKRTYGNTEKFGTTVVRGELLKSGLYVCRHCGSYPPTTADAWHAFYACDHSVITLGHNAEAARAELEGHLADVLRAMRQRRGAWMDRQPREALMTAVITVAARREPTAILSEADLDWSFVDHCGRFFAIDLDAAGGGGGDGDGGDGDAGGD